MKPESLNKIIHERVRLAIMSALAARGELTFNELKELLDLTDGNLSAHSSLLETHGLVRIKKDFAGKKPRTTLSLTARGRKEFSRYLAELQKIIKGVPDPGT